MKILKLSVLISISFIILSCSEQEKNNNESFVSISGAIEIPTEETQTSNY